MKKITFLISAFSLLVLFSCKKDENQAVVSDNPVAAAITNLTDGSAFTLKKEDASKTIPFEWSAADFGFASSNTYTLQMDEQGNNFADAKNLGTVNNATTLTVLTSELNNKLLEMKADPQDPSPMAVEFRIKATISSNYAPAYSPVVKQTVTPYVSAIVYPTLYMLGDGCTAGWNNNSALPMSGGAGGIYTITTTLTAGKYVKFITTLGQWAPMYGTDAAATSAGGNLVYRATEAVTDPASIPTPAADGSYTVTANITNLTFTITAK